MARSGYSCLFTLILKITPDKTLRRFINKRAKNNHILMTDWLKSSSVLTMLLIFIGQTSNGKPIIGHSKSEYLIYLNGYCHCGSFECGSVWHCLLFRHWLIFSFQAHDREIGGRGCTWWLGDTRTDTLWSAHMPTWRLGQHRSKLIFPATKAAARES